MNWDRIQNNWNQYKTTFRETFNKLTDADIDMINGRRDQFLVKLQERYGYSRDIAEQKLTDFTTNLGTGGTPPSKGTGTKKTEKV